MYPQDRTPSDECAPLALNLVGFRQSCRPAYLLPWLLDCYPMTMLTGEQVFISIPVLRHPLKNAQSGMIEGGVLNLALLRGVARLVPDSALKIELGPFRRQYLILTRASQYQQADDICYFLVPILC